MAIGERWPEGGVITRKEVLRILSAHRSADKAVGELMDVGFLEPLKPNHDGPRGRGRPTKRFRVHPLGTTGKFYEAFVEDFRTRLLPTAVIDALRHNEIGSLSTDLRGLEPGTSPFVLQVRYYPATPARVPKNSRDRKRLERSIEGARYHLALANMHLSYLLLNGAEVPLVILPFVTPTPMNYGGFHRTIAALGKTLATEGLGGLRSSEFEVTDRVVLRGS